MIASGVAVGAGAARARTLGYIHSASVLVIKSTSLSKNLAKPQEA